MPPASSQPTAAPSPAGSSRGPGEAGSAVLVAYFSRPGENYYYGDRTWLEVGNTEVMAGMIAQLAQCDVHRIQATEPYPSDYEQTVARNVREQDADVRPGIAGSLPDIGPYDVILLGSPIWNVRSPMIMTTFTEQLDFTGKRVHPFTTHAMSGLGNTERDYGRSCRGATLGEGLAVRGEEVGDARPQVSAWLTRIGLVRA